MENRSFDHFLGWLPGADGRQAGLTLHRPLRRHAPDPPPHRLPGLRLRRPRPLLRGRARSSTTTAAATAGSRPGENDEFAIGYYTDADLAFYGQAAPRLDGVRPLLLRHHGRDLPEPLLPARRADRPAPQLDRRSRRCRRSGTGSPAPGVTGRYYFSDVPFTALWGTKYLGISKPFAAVPRRRGGRDAAGGVASSTRGSSTRAPAPRATTIRTPTSAPGEHFLDQVYDAVTTGPGWASTVLVINYDEWGGFYDHVAPRPAPRRRPRTHAPARLPRAVPGRVAAGAARLRRPQRLRPHLDPEDDRVALGPPAADAARRRRAQPRRGARLRAPPRTSPRRVTPCRRSSAAACPRPGGDRDAEDCEWPS